ncbi:hypothetical protein [Acutalibacter sp. 1XD8-36]|uniref:hypothetical protein n=1 Tax=Acutalibacter sp. 1XD8-36 TaxID=2320852 RepID=UPI00262F205B|nr:hypothetical protein [Acutalibacter sp. 1XD8-36]
MLRKLYEDGYAQYLDSAYRLALDMSRSCYPTYADGLKTRQDFDEAAKRPFKRDNYTMLLYEQEGKALGLIQYYVLDEDKYVQPDIFCIEQGYGMAVEEFAEYLHRELPGYTLHFGVSEKNRAAVEALEGLGASRDEVSLVGVMRFEEYSPLPETERVVPVTRENFGAFAELHSQWDGQMYWDNAHLLEALDDWHIYYVQKEGRALAAVYYRYVDGSMEIFGIDFEGDRFDEGCFRALMVRALNESKRDGMKDMTFFHDEESRPAVNSVGIRTIDTYFGYSYKL